MRGLTGEEEVAADGAAGRAVTGALCETCCRSSIAKFSSPCKAARLAAIGDEIDLWAPLRLPAPLRGTMATNFDADFPFAGVAECVAFCTAAGPSCVASCEASHMPATVVDGGKLVVTLILLLLSGMFSGLTLGLLTLSIEGLDIIIEAGDDPDEKRWAQRIYPLRKRGNTLLCTLLVGNTLVNSLIAIFSAEMTSGVVGGLISTIVIVIFGEIIPQSVCARHGLRIGAYAVWIVWPLVVILRPITFPIAFLLDYMLGREMGMQYNKNMLDKLVEQQVAAKEIDNESAHVLQSMLKFAEKDVALIMTNLEHVFCLDVTDVLDFEKLKAIYSSGYTRIPVFQTTSDNIVGVLFAKDLILIDPNDEIPVASILPFCSRPLNAVHKSTRLDLMLHEMQMSRAHLYFVTGNLPGAAAAVRAYDQLRTTAPVPDHPAAPRRKLARVNGVVGIVTLEDVIEELIADEIVDETDVVTDNLTWRRVAETRRSNERLGFFEMLQRKEEMLDGEATSVTTKTDDEVRALTSFISSNVAAFKPGATYSQPLLRRLVQRSPLYDLEAPDIEHGSRYVYVRGVPAAYACLLLHGRLEIRAGNDGFQSEFGPWTLLCASALLGDGNHRPDFTARVTEPSRVLLLLRADLLSVQRESEVSAQTRKASSMLSGDALARTLDERRNRTPPRRRYPGYESSGLSSTPQAERRGVNPSLGGGLGGARRSSSASDLAGMEGQAEQRSGARVAQLRRRCCGREAIDIGEQRLVGEVPPPAAEDHVAGLLAHHLQRDGVLEAAAAHRWVRWETAYE